MGYGLVTLAWYLYFGDMEVPEKPVLLLVEHSVSQSRRSNMVDHPPADCDGL